MQKLQHTMDLIQLLPCFTNQERGVHSKGQRARTKGVGGPMTRAKMKILRDRLEEQITLNLETDSYHEYLISCGRFAIQSYHLILNVAIVLPISYLLPPCKFPFNF